MVFQRNHRQTPSHVSCACFVFAWVCSDHVLFVGKFKSVHAKWLLENKVDEVEEEDVPAETPLSGHWETLGKIIVFHQENQHIRQEITHSAEDVATEANCKLEAPDPVGVFQLTNNIHHITTEEKQNLPESFSPEAP